MNLHPHTGVKWMPGAVARHPYAGGYAMDSSTARQSDNPAGWSLSMSQTQSLYLQSNAAGDVPYHISGPPNLAAAGYPPAVTAGAVQVSDPSRMQRIPNAAGGGDVIFQRNAAAPGQMYMDVYPAAAYNSRDFAFNDTVFVSK